MTPYDPNTTAGPAPVDELGATRVAPSLPAANPAGATIIAPAIGGGQTQGFGAASFTGNGAVGGDTIVAQPVSPAAANAEAAANPADPGAEATAQGEGAATRARFPVKAMAAAIVLPLLFGFLFGAASLSSSRAVRTPAAGSAFTAGDTGIYQNGVLVLDVEDAVARSFWFSLADSYNLDAKRIATLRGLSIGRPDTDILAQYGPLRCQISYDVGYRTETLFDVPFEAWYQSNAYTGSYTVTFASHLASGVPLADESRLANLYAAGSTNTLEEYGVTFVVTAGAVADIECYAHVIPT